MDTPSQAIAEPVALPDVDRTIDREEPRNPHLLKLPRAVHVDHEALVFVYKGRTCLTITAILENMVPFLLAPSQGTLDLPASVSRDWFRLGLAGWISQC